MNLLSKNWKKTKYFSDCIFTMKGSNIKKTILRGFCGGHPFCLHAKFQFWYSTPSRFVKKITYFCIIFAEKYFPAKYLRVYTSTKNFIKIRPKMSKRQPIKKKTFFYLLPLLTYCALFCSTPFKYVFFCETLRYGTFCR